MRSFSIKTSKEVFKTCRDNLPLNYLLDVLDDENINIDEEGKTYQFVGKKARYDIISTSSIIYMKQEDDVMIEIEDK